MSKPLSRENIYTKDVLDRLWKAAATAEDRFLLVCLMHGGMRVGEVAHLRPSWWTGSCFKLPKREPCTCCDCRFDQARRIKNHELYDMPLKAGDEESFWQPKTRDGARIVPIPPFYQPLVTNYLPRYIGIHPVNIRKHLKALAVKAGLQDVNVFPHAMRATLASTFADQGIDAWVMKAFFGWSNIASADAYVRTSQKRIETQLREKGVW